MSRYLETFFRHKILLIAPVVLALAISIWYVAARPKSFQSSATLWVDTQPPAASSIDAPGNGPTPAAQAQSVLQELVATRSFMLKAGHRSALATYVATHPSKNNGPTALLSKAMSAFKHKASPTVDDRIVATLSGKVTSSVVGPQVVRVNLAAPDPSISQSALTGILAEYGDELAADRSGRDQAAVQYYQQQLTSANAALSDARGAEVAYVTAHPEVANPTTPDPEFASLVQATADAQTNYTQAKNALTAATESLTTVKLEDSFHIVDAPQFGGAVSGKKKEIFAAVAGLLLGILVSVLGLVALTASDTSARRVEDLGLADDTGSVVASIEQYSQRGAPRLASRYSHRRTRSS